MSQTSTSDELVFADERSHSGKSSQMDFWKVLIVDDEPEIHAVTKLALSGFSFADKALKFRSAFSGDEAKELLAQHPDAALILLDVVMENDHAGLDLVRYIRNDLKNATIRIVLRTGQPGQAPEKSVIRDYDINDYKEKTELTSQKLYTLLYSCLRSYKDLMTIEESKRGLEKVIEASATILEPRSMERFVGGIMEQLTSLLQLDEDAVFCQTSGLAAEGNRNDMRVLVATGNFEGSVGQKLKDVLPADRGLDVQENATGHRHVLTDGHYTSNFVSASGVESLIHLAGLHQLSSLDRRLVDIFSKNVGIAFENMYLKSDIEDTQKEVVYRLSEAVETRSRETGNHVKRVAEYSRLLALGYGLSEGEAETIRLASPLHDVGKIGIPDAILNKPGPLTPDEWVIMQTHATLGYDLLKGSQRPILQAGATIALEHHEKWIGNGYPHKKKGEDIHIYGRISALADVFDALGSDRCYKKAWDLDRILDLLREERGKHFDPRTIDIFFSELDAFLFVRDAYMDEVSGVV
jgi:response regulator RpfG family c-di-GMP phosphodiesterase